MTFEDSEDRTIFSLLRLRLPEKTTSSQPSPLKEKEKEQDQLNSPLLQRRGVRGEVLK